MQGSWNQGASQAQLQRASQETWVSAPPHCQGAATLGRSFVPLSCSFLICHSSTDKTSLEPC